MGVFHIFKIVQMIPNRATHHIMLAEVLVTPLWFLQEIILTQPKKIVDLDWLMGLNFNFKDTSVVLLWSRIVALNI